MAAGLRRAGHGPHRDRGGPANQRGETRRRQHAQHQGGRRAGRRGVRLPGAQAHECYLVRAVGIVIFRSTK